MTLTVHIVELNTTTKITSKWTENAIAIIITIIIIIVDMTISFIPIIITTTTTIMTIFILPEESRL
jgi:hypothetical protein